MKQLQNQDFNHSTKKFALIKHLIGTVYLSPNDKNYLNSPKIISRLNS